MNRHGKRIFGLSFMLTVIVIFGVTVQVVEARRTPDWQNALAPIGYSSIVGLAPDQSASKEPVSSERSKAR